MGDDSDNTTDVPCFLDDVQRVDRKRMRMDGLVRKCWSLTDRPSDREVLEEMGVGILEQEDSETGVETPSCSHASMMKSGPKRKRDIENVSPNVQSGGRALAKPARHKSTRSFSGSPSSACSPGNDHIAGTSRAIDTSLTERSINEQTDTTDEETPLPLLPAAGLHRMAQMHQSSPGISSVGSVDWPASGGSREGVSRVHSSCSDVISPYKQEEACLIGDLLRKDCDVFSNVSEEVMLQVFKWLPKRNLVRCMLVCRKWHRVASDESLWQRLELGERVLSRGALGRILSRKPIVLRLASAEIGHWVGAADMRPCKLQYLDLSTCSIDKPTLNSLLRCCPALRKLSLETLHTDGDTCEIIGGCSRIETLNMTMATGLTEEGISSILHGCPGLQSLNISWCKLSAGSLRQVCMEAPQHLSRLNVAGARLLTDDMVKSLTERCPRLLELDLSDCTKLTEASMRSVSQLSRLEHLAVSRCYHLEPHSLTHMSLMPSLQFLEVWGMLQPAALAALTSALSPVAVNKFMLSAIARPTVGPRRTSIWGLRTRD